MVSCQGVGGWGRGGPGKGVGLASRVPPPLCCCQVFCESVWFGCVPSLYVLRHLVVLVASLAVLTLAVAPLPLPPVLTLCPRGASFSEALRAVLAFACVLCLSACRASWGVLVFWCAGFCACVDGAVLRYPR